MTKKNFYRCLLLSGLSLGLISSIACDSSNKKAAPQSVTEQKDVITGPELKEDYAKLLCTKYNECGIKAFSDDQDCLNRVKEVLQQDTKWKGLKLATKKLNACLDDIKQLSCENFQGGEAPESCQNL